MTSFHDLDPASAILFDLDGTIIDSRQGIVSTLHHVIARLGHEPDPARDLTWVVGPPLAELMEEVLRPYGEHRVAEAVEIYRARYQTHGRFQTPLYDGVADLLHRIAASPARLFTATSKPAFLARDILQTHGLDRLFDEICGANPDDSGAEKPELIARILRDHAIPSNKAVMIGDRRFDITGAQANHLRTIGVLWGYGGQAELTAAGADVLCERPEALGGMIRAQLAAAWRHRPAA
ncbi:HAD hydrolase-like protein [Acidomonas methanolica]|uniref:HAD hydrolase-like protein n=1 Tax=Acidomonas methanolica TaxID=437 RepID=UPI00211A9CB8|nr:HAD hydrolase-like protein [Acidomonas methanolica]MCQ9155066.1 HAD hydrolase-like protein [Acidomonas methanolica]